MQKFNIPTSVNDFQQYNWRGFLIALVGACLMALFSAFDFHPFAKIINPIVAQEKQQSVDIVNEIIKPKIEAIPNTYAVKTPRSSLVPLAAAEEEQEFDSLNAYAVVDFETGNILFEKNGSEQFRIASLTKIMTAVVALDLADPEEEFEMTETAARQVPTKIGIVPGEKMKLRELLEAILMTSANDAAHAIMDGINEKYGQTIFIDTMNAKAQFLGLQNTSFDNPQGFDGLNNYSSAHDLAVLSHYAMTHYPLFAEIAKKDYDYLPENSDHKQFDLHNWNGLIGVYPNTIGIKIGNTDAAGKTTVVVSERGGQRLLVVALGAPGLYERDRWAADLLDRGYQKMLGLEPVGVTEEQLQAKYDSWTYTH